MALLERGMFALLASLSESAPFVILGLLLAGLIHEFVPQSVIEKRLGGVGFAPVLRAVGLGSLLPICSCSTIPLGLGMARSGASTGTVLAFMTSAPALSPVTIVLGFSLLGPALLGSYAVAVLCGSCLLGLLGNSIFKTKDLAHDDLAHDQAEPCSNGCGCNSESSTTGRRVSSAVRWALFDFGSEVSLSLVTGLLIGTILLVFTPDAWVTQLIGQPSIVAILTVMLLALPAYTCSVPALLIAASLIAKGANPGVAVAFLVAGPATNFGELNSIRVGLGNRVAGFYFLAVATLAVIAAMTIGAMQLPNSPNAASMATDSAGHEHRHLHFGSAMIDSPSPQVASQAMAYWRWPFVALISGLALYSLAMVALRRLYKSWPSPAGTPETDPPITVVSLETHAIEGSRR